MSEKEESKSPSMKLAKKPKGGTKPETVGAVEAVTETPVQSLEKVEPATETLQSASATEQGDLIVTTVHEIENMKEEKAFKLVPQLLNNIEHDYFKLGGVLAVIQAQGWFMDKGYENFRAYVESECGIKYRKACYLIEIYNGLVASGVEWEKVKSLGWTKLREIAKHLTPENTDEWVERASAMKTLQLQAYIAELTAAPASDGKVIEGSGSKVTTMTFKLHEDQKETIREALAKCKHETGTEHDSVALEHIALDYLGGESKIKAMPSLAELMKGKSAEEVLGVFGEVFPEVELSATLPEE